MHLRARINHTLRTLKTLFTLRTRTVFGGVLNDISVQLESISSVYGPVKQSSIAVV
jgi:hypothetical protein